VRLLASAAQASVAAARKAIGEQAEAAKPASGY
jgi:hypothetical protein